MRPQAALPVEISEKINWISIGAAIASITAVGVAIGLGLPLLSVILEKRGIAPTLIGLNSAVAGVASMVAAPLTTGLARRVGVVPTMLFAIILSAVSALGFYFAENFLLWFPLRIVFHGAITVLFILSEFWINATAPQARRGLVMGIYATVLSLGFAAGPWLFSIMGSDGILPFLVGAGILLLSAIPVLAAHKQSPVIEERSTVPFVRYIWLVPTATAAVFVFGAVESGGLALFPIYALRNGYLESDAALLLTMIGLGNVIFQIPIGLLADRMKDKRGLLFAFAVIGVVGSCVMPAIIDDWNLMLVMLLIWGGCVAGLYTVGLTHLGSKLSGADLASANAAFVFCYSLGMLAGPQALGAGMDVMGNSGFAWVLAFFFGLYVVLALGRMIVAPRR